jgi:tetratricopeptide (TPR) repeat protein
MIVKDEGAVIERCLASVRPLIDHWTIVDTGSSDDTTDRVRAALADVPGTLHERPWVDFGTNRSELMALARGTADYLLLVDADQTIRIDGPLPALDATAYLLVHDGSPTYKIPRLVRGDLPWRFVGATHEYLACDGVGPIDQVLDQLVVLHHADGGARADKFTRDRRLLERAVRDDPDDPRSAFYLAQTYADVGEVALAIDEYRRRIALGGWDEERFCAQLRIGQLLTDVDWDRAVPELLQAWEMRPSRAEPLHALARGYRIRGQHWLAAVFARTGLSVPFPADDLLFVEPEPYRWGLLFELSIAAYWSGSLDESLRASDALLDGAAPDALKPWVHHNRYAARRELGIVDETDDDGPEFSWIALEPVVAPLLAELAEGTRFELLQPATGDPDVDWSLFNPSIANGPDGLALLLRRANYRRDPEGRYHLLDDVAEVRTRNRFRVFDRDGAVVAEHRLPEIPPGATTHPANVIGVEDLRPIHLAQGWFGIGTCRDRHVDNTCQMIVWDLGPAGRGEGPIRLLASPGVSRHEKNWMPFEVDGALHVVYACHPLVVLRVDPATGETTEVSRRPTQDFARYLRGGSQGVKVAEGRWRFVVHEVSGTTEAQRTYLHRIIDVAMTDHGAFELVAATPRFSFTGRPIEFCAGLAVRGDDLVLSFGVDDAQALLASTPLDVVEELLEPVGVAAPGR